MTGGCAASGHETGRRLFCGPLAGVGVELFDGLIWVRSANLGHAERPHVYCGSPGDSGRWAVWQHRHGRKVLARMAQLLPHVVDVKAPNAINCCRDVRCKGHPDDIGSAALCRCRRWLPCAVLHQGEICGSFYRLSRHASHGERIHKTLV